MNSRKRLFITRPTPPFQSMISISLSAPREVDVSIGPLSRCYLVTNNSDKTVQALWEADYDKVDSLLAVTYYFPDGGGSYTLFVKLSDGALMCAQHEGWITGYEDGAFYMESGSFALDSLTFTPMQY